jgi:uncharacterized phiE125 gp8 family phage protein
MSIHRYWRVKTAAAAVAVSTADAKTHLRVTDTDSDTYIASLVALATRIYEERACTSLINQTIVLYLDRFPYGDDGPIYLPRGPVTTVTHVKYYDASNTLTTLAAASYRLNIYQDVPVIEAAYGYTWPDARENITGAVEIEYAAGYGAAAANLPELPVHAIKLLLSHYYERRESTSEDAVHEVPETLDALIALDNHRFLPPQE